MTISNEAKAISTNNRKAAQQRLNEAVLALVLSQEGKYLEPEEQELHDAFDMLTGGAKKHEILDLFPRFREIFNCYPAREIEDEHETDCD